MKQSKFNHPEIREYTTPSVLAKEIELCFPACLQTSNGATTENYEEEDIWNK